MIRNKVTSVLLAISFALFCTESFSSVLEKSKRTLTIVSGAEDYPPYEITVNGKFGGYHIELLQSAAKRLGITLEFKRYPIKRAETLLELGEVDAMTYIGKTPKRETYVYYHPGNVLHTATISLIVPVGQQGNIHYDGSLASVSKHTIFTQLGFTYGSRFDDARFIIKEPVRTLDQMVQSLALGRGNLGIIYRRNFEKVYGETDEAKMLQILEPPISVREMYIGFSKVKNNQEIGLQFAKGLLAFRKTDVFKAIHQKYFPP